MYVFNVVYIPKKRGVNFEIIKKQLVQCSEKEIVLTACNGTYNIDVH